MKTRVLLIISLFLLTFSYVQSQEMNTENNASVEKSITVSASPEIYALAQNWAGEFCKANPTYKINIVEQQDTKEGTPLKNSATLSFFDAASLKDLNNSSAWNIVVGRNVTVPVMNAHNPYIDGIARKGISAENLSRLLQNPERQDWGLFLGTGVKLPLHYYSSSDRSVQEGLKSYLNNDQLKNSGIATASASELITQIGNDPNGLGFCKLSDLTNNKGSHLSGNIRLVPIDKNGNGQIDFMEDIYDNLQDFSRGVWIGKYPKALSGNIYAVSLEKPQTEAGLAFMNWVLTDGQQLLENHGYCDLVSGERQTQLDKLRNTTIDVASPERSNYAILRTIILVVLAFAAIGFITDIMSRYFRNRHAPVKHGPVRTTGVFDLESVRAPKGLFYDRTHTWTFMESDGSVKIGIDDFLQHITGPISRINLRASGEKIKKGERLLTLVQNGKQLNIQSPVTGTIIAQNMALIKDASLLNATPMNQGWIYSIEPANWSLEIQFMSMSGMYKTWLKDEFTRLKDFFAMVNMPGTPAFSHVALQDGGTFTDNILENFGPEVWEDFQTDFIDNSR